MSEATQIKADIAAREEALNPARSFIVQAPAGSGKTGLLVYRMLRLLAVAAKPDEVVAITFTRKARQEMLDRLLRLLNDAKNNAEASDAHHQKGIQLADEVLSRDHSCNWNLLTNPRQLQILTIDAFAQKLLLLTPWSADLLSGLQVNQQPEEYYHAATDELFRDLTQKGHASHQDLLIVLEHLDFDYARMRRLLVTMLHRRDQWLRHIATEDIDAVRPLLEEFWQKTSEQELDALNQSLNVTTVDELCAIASEAAVELAAQVDDQSNPLAVFLHFESGQLDISVWRVLRYLLLTKDGSKYRARFTKEVGFPTHRGDLKSRIKAVIDAIDNDEHIRQSLNTLDMLPLTEFEQNEWQLLSALLRVLLQLVARLLLQFKRNNECDHIEITRSALQSLKYNEHLTDLVQKSDARIRHLLVDEFQDTSRTQLELLQALTEGWEGHQESGANSLFLVGDPMQSIYSFREAEVELFRQVIDNNKTGVFANIEIKALRLAQNFRSDPILVNWVNKTFAQTSTQSKATVTQVPFVTAFSRQQYEGARASLSWVEDDDAEAETIVQTVKQFQSESQLFGRHNSDKIALLASSRSHLSVILPRLQSAGIPYSGVDLAALDKYQEVADIVSLCRAMSNLNDRLAWLALLRGPWCGLRTSTMITLLNASPQPVWMVMREVSADDLSTSAYLRLDRFRSTMQKAIEQLPYLGLVETARWTWLQLGGSESLQQLSRRDIEATFDCIELQSTFLRIKSLKRLQQSLAKRFSNGAPEDSQQLIVSTIHKAKGLEFDSVILAGMGRGPRVSTKELLMWWEKPEVDAKTTILFAPLVGSDEDCTHYKYLRNIEVRKKLLETERLMYVACTRAKRRLAICCKLSLAPKNGELRPPRQNSSIFPIWSRVSDQFEQSPYAGKNIDEETRSHLLHRLSHHYRPQTRQDFAWQMQAQLLPAEEPSVDDGVNFEWATELATAVGIVFHEYLHSNRLDILNQVPAQGYESQWRARLLQLQLPEDRINAALKRLRLGWRQVAADKEAHFLLADYREQDSELDIVGNDSGRLRRYRLDRTFVDQKGVRWIVDFKTTYTEVANINEFVDSQIELRHQQQLESYAAIMSRLDQRPIELAVYFPMLAQLRHWSYPTKN